MTVKILLDFPYTNYQANSLVKNYKHIFLLEKSYSKGSISKHLVGKTKTSQSSKNLGEIITGKYLNESDCSEVIENLQMFKNTLKSNDKIICFGSVSSKLLTGFGIKKSVGRSHNIEIDNLKYDVFCMWNPDQVFTSERIRKDFERHFRDLKVFISSKNDSDEKYRNIETRIVSEKELKDLTQDSKLISYDIETSKFGKVDMISICTEGSLLNDMAYLVKNPSYNFCSDIMHGKICISHKGTYDNTFLIKECGLDLSEIEWYDTSYFSRLREPDMLYALHEVQKRYCPNFKQWKNK